MKSFLLFWGAIGLVAAQPYACSTTGATNIVRSEGLTERIGDIVFYCTGVPNSTIQINLNVQMNSTVSNRLSSGNTITGTILTVDNGSGPQASTVQPLLLAPNTLAWNGVPLAYTASGALTIRVADIRVNANEIGQGGQVTATIGSAGSILISQSQLVVGVVQASLYVGNSADLICAQTGSPLPGNPGFASLINAGTAFTTTRLTEGFSGAFSPKSAPANLNADTGTRFIVRYNGFPQAAQLFVPNVVAGSDAVTPTAGGDMGLPTSGGSYAPTVSGSLLLALVSGADSTGAGGTVVYTPGPVGSGPVSFDAVTQLQIVNGSAYAVYEVIDSSQFVLESAQFPTFMGLAPNVVQTNTETSESVTYAPVSELPTASTNAPIPRFLPLLPKTDCSIIGDCGAAYYPQLDVSSNPLQFTLPANSPNKVLGLPVLNSGAGVLYWSAGVTYTSGSGGWLTISPTSGMNNGSISVYANPGNLPVGTYQATITVTGATGGQRVVPVTLTITPATNPGPSITSVVNAASFAQAPVVPGSLATIMGSALTGKNVTASFNGLAATVVFSNATQINLLVPAALASLISAQLSVSVDGQTSLPMTVPVAPFEPGIFAGAVVNQDATVNSITNAAASGSIIYFYATGLSGSGTISARIGSTEITNLYYAGPAPGFPGIQQVNLLVPAGMGGISTQLYACGTSNGTEVCSLPVSLTLK